MFKMSKIKLLILALTVIKASCSNRDYTDIFKVDDTWSTYETRMKEKGLPIFGQSYDDFMKDTQNKDFTRDEYKVLMDSIPVIYETMDTVNERNSGTSGLQVYDSEVFTYLTSYYPELYETHTEYSTRIVKADFGTRLFSTEVLTPGKHKEFTFDRIMFQGLKRVFPNVGEIYSDYKSRMDSFGITGFSNEYFDSFLKIIPKPHETIDAYLHRFNNEFGCPSQKWKYPTVEMYSGLHRLVPIFGETHEEYKYRMTEMDLSTMTLEAFKKFQMFYPEFIEKFRDYVYRNRHIDFSDHTYLYELNDQSFTFLKNRKPLLFENRNDFRSRMETTVPVDDTVILYPEYDCVRRTYPKFSESFPQYYNRLKQFGLNVWHKHFFFEFKKNYPQIGLDYEELSGSPPVLHLDQMSYRELKKKMPIPFGVYPYYVDKMIKQKLRPLEEDDHDDFKKVFIKQSENYKDYCSRMELIGIRPMTEASAIFFKQIIPKKWKIAYDDYMIEGAYLRNENMKLYDLMEFSIFKKIAPMPFEYYPNYTTRVIGTNVLYDIAMNKYKRPLHEEEFMDLKLRYPKLKEKADDYFARLLSYMIVSPIDSEIMFNAYKQVQVQIGDDYEKYKKRVSIFDDLDFQVLSETDFHSSMLRIPSPFEVDYTSYLKTHAPNVFHEDTFNDYLSVYPKYYSTYNEYLNAMDDIDLVPVSKAYFIKLKLSFPNFLEFKYEEYQLKMETSGLEKMTETQFYTFKFKIPQPYEGPKVYEARVRNLYPVGTKNFENIYSHFIRVIPRLSGTYKEYEQLMELLCIEPMDINYFESYKNFFPEHDETEYSKYYKRLNGSQRQYLLMEMKSGFDTSYSSSSLMTNDQFEAFRSRLPSVHERYKNYIYRNNTFECFCEAEFNDLKFLYSLSYENHTEHVQRMTDSFRKPLSLEAFLEEKSMRVLLGEKYSEHFKKIKEKYENQVEKSTDSKDFIDKMKSLGIETLDHINFIEHKLTYPYKYGSFEYFCSIMNDHNWKGTPATTEIWYKRMKAFQPKICDEFEDYNIRARIYGFPDMTEIQFRRTKNGLPAPGEGKTDFLKRINTIAETEPYMKALHLNFTLISPNFHDNYPAYTARVQQYGDPMNLLEFKCFMEYLPKLEDNLSTFNKKIKLSGFNELNLKSFTNLKLFFPRIYHYTHDNYVLDIAVNHLDMNVVESLKLNADEFNEYKSKFPRQFELYYAAYCDRMTKEKITKIFTKEEFEIFRAANFPLPDEDRYQHIENMKSQGLNSLPKDVFYFFKGLYPILFEPTYFYRTQDLVPQLLDAPNYKEWIYQANLTKPIVNEIINRLNTYQELINKHNSLMFHLMSSKEFEEFTMSIPKLFESYSAYKLSMLETTYFPPIDENYSQYIARMEKIKNDQHLNVEQFNEFTLNFSFGVVSHEEYSSMVTPEKNALLLTAERYYQFIDAYFPKIHEEHSGFMKRFEFLSENILNDTEYKEFVRSFPTEKLLYSAFKPNSECSVYFAQIDKDYKEYKTRMMSKSLTELLSEQDYESMKNDYFTSFYKEDYNYFNRRLKFQTIKVMTMLNFIKFKENFPSVFKPYTEFKKSLSSKGAIMSEKKYISLTNAFFPPIYESAQQYYDRMEVLKNNIMSDHEFKEFTINFPLISKSYNAYKSCLQRADRPQKARIGMISYEEGASRIMDEKFFNSLKSAYFPKLNESFRKYDKRMVSIGFEAWPENLFRICNNVYPKQLKFSFQSYKNNFPEPQISRHIDHKILTGMKNIGCVPLNLDAFTIYEHNIPKILQSYANYVIYLADNYIIKMFNEDQFESVKDIHYPKLTENFDKYSERMEILGMESVEISIFQYYKHIYPRVDETFTQYTERVQHFSKELPSSSTVGKLVSHQLEKEEFSYFLDNGPRLVENHKFYLKRKSEERPNINNEFGLHSRQMYSQLKDVFMPSQGETMDEYVKNMHSLSLNVSDEDPYFNSYYSKIMQLYPQFFECYGEYLERTQESKLLYLRLTETEFNLFFSSYPRPFESFRNYVNRRQGEEYSLDKKQFDKYRRIYPRLQESKVIYNERLSKTFGYSKKISPAVFRYFKYIYPFPDESYKAYSERFALLFIAEETNESEFVSKEEHNFLLEVLKVTMMTLREFKSFKLSLPRPYELYSSYVNRIEILKADQFKNLQFPFTEDLFNDIKISYPKTTELEFSYTMRLRSYQHLRGVKNLNNFHDNFEKAITTSLEHMFWSYI